MSSQSQKRIYILGGAQSDFARKISREDHDIFDLFSEVLTAGLESAELDPSA